MVIVAERRQTRSGYWWCCLGSTTRKRILAEAIGAFVTFSDFPNNQYDQADNWDKADKHPPRGLVDVVQSPRKNGQIRKHEKQAQNSKERRVVIVIFWKNYAV